MNPEMVIMKIKWKRKFLYDGKAHGTPDKIQKNAKLHPGINLKF